MNATWKPFQHLWEVNSSGQVRNRITGLCLKLRRRKDGYIDVKLSYSRFLVHRLVAELFVPNPNNLPQVNHINGVKTDCLASNLEWVTGAENVRHGFKAGLYPSRRGEANHRATISAKDAADIKRLLAEGASIKWLVSHYNVTYHVITNIKYGKAWAHLKDY